MSRFHPIVSEWFARRFASATPAQAQAWPVLQSGGDSLISAPTGSGKTLAAFLVCLDRLVRAASSGTLEDRIEVVYVSPLKALSNDIQKNLDAPLAEIAALAAERGTPLPPIRTAVRTGDTPARERQQMLRRPPHILVTTPESLFILLTAGRSREALKGVRTVIIDEIHAVVDDKRGAHLGLSLARLDDLVEKAGGRPPQRIGLSATVRPIEEVARFLSPAREVTIVDTGHRRAMDLAVEVPRDELGAVASHEMWAEIYDRLVELILAHRTTLVFVNTRRLAERVSHKLTERLGENVVLAHHGSLSRRLRLDAEQRLKRGELRAVVATASLELGIDIGSVDLVCQIGSTRAIGVALQRMGRSGHQPDSPGATTSVVAPATSVPKGRLFATTRDDLIESAALMHAIRSGALDRLEIPAWPRDVLAQQMVAAASCDAFTEDELFALVRRAHSYHDLPRSEFDAIVEMLSDGIATGRGRRSAWLHRDRVNNVVKGRRGARLAAITSGGAIPDNANYLVVVEPEGAVVGTVDEDFAVESLAGDIFLLGTASWRIRRVEAGRVRVEDAQGAPPTVPFWNGEAPGRTIELSSEVSRVREAILRAPTRDAATAFLAGECGLDRLGAEQAIDYVRAGAGALGALPTDRTVVAERFFDEAGGMQLVLHAPFGARINRAWGLALRKRFCRSFNFELQAAATDNGIVISLSEQHSFALDAVFRFLSPPTVEDVLTQAMLDAPMFQARWRWNAARMLAVLRFAGGRKVPPPIQRMRSDDLLAAVFPDQAACGENLVGDIRIPDHPLVNETIRDCLHEAMDLDGLMRVIEGMTRGEIRTLAVDTAEPSPFSHEILNANPYAFLDDAPLEERRTRAVQLRRTLPADAGDVGALDAAAIATVAGESWPVVRDADELHDALLTLVVLPPVSDWEPFFDKLTRAGRATAVHADGVVLWAAAERVAHVRLLYADATLAPDMHGVTNTPAPDRDAAATETIRGWLESIGPTTGAQLASRLALPCAVVEGALLHLESRGEILRGRFTSANAQRPTPNGNVGAVREPPLPAPGTPEIEWCNRRVLARIHRLTIGRLRREIEPVTTADFMRFLFRWQHVAPGTQLHGVDGVLHVLEQLQGYEISTSAWERYILPARIARYSPELLDRVCLSGDAMWGRLSPHPGFVREPAEAGPHVERADSTGRSGRTDSTGRPGRSGRKNGLPELAELPVNDLPDSRRVRPTRVAPMAIMLRDDAGWLLEGARQQAERQMVEASLSGGARQVLEALRRRGASFIRELTQATRLPHAGVEEALWELASAGLVTADGFENLRDLIDPKRRRGEGRASARRGRYGAPRLGSGQAGRWALLAPGDETSGLSHEARADRFARQLLLRWGVVFRDLLARETLAPPWRDLLVALRRMEARGEIRGGRFVSGFVGEQFARPDALDALRALKRATLPPEGGSHIQKRNLPAEAGSHTLHSTLTVAAADPLNLAGIITPGPRVSALTLESVELLPAAEAAAV